MKFDKVKINRIADAFFGLNCSPLFPETKVKEDFGLGVRLMFESRFHLS